MLIHFQVEKAIQASAVLLKAEQSKCMSRLRLLKLLYIADREALHERARPIVGDHPVAMDHGPVLSRVYDLIKGEDFCASRWQTVIESRGRDVVLLGDPGVGELSKYEIQKLHEVSARFADSNDYAIAVLTHDFEEYVKNRPDKGSAKRIPLEDLLAATGRIDQKDALEARYHAESIADHFLSES